MILTVGTLLLIVTISCGQNQFGQQQGGQFGQQGGQFGQSGGQAGPQGGQQFGHGEQGEHRGGGGGRN